MKEEIINKSGQIINTVILVGMLVVGVRFYDSLATKDDIELSILDLQINQTAKELIKIQMIETLGGELTRFQRANIQSLEIELAELKAEKDRRINKKGVK